MLHYYSPTRPGCLHCLCLRSPGWRGASSCCWRSWSDRGTSQVLCLLQGGWQSRRSTSTGCCRWLRPPGSWGCRRVCPCAPGGRLFPVGERLRTMLHSPRRPMTSRTPCWAGSPGCAVSETREREQEKTGESRWDALGVWLLTCGDVPLLYL